MKVDKGIILIYELIAEAMPNSPDVFESLGDAHMLNGDSNRAIEYYEKALRIAPQNRKANDMLNMLRARHE